MKPHHTKMHLWLVVAIWDFNLQWRVVPSSNTYQHPTWS